jgi:hypothetical protein
MITPELIYDYACSHVQPVKKYEPLIAKDAYSAYFYSNYITRKQFTIAEYIISKNPEVSLLYAQYVLNKRFPQAEQNIKNSKFKNQYEKSFNCKL